MKQVQCPLDLSVIESRLTTRVIGRPVGAENELWDQIDSTNNRALQLAKQSTANGVIILAQSQTAGRGRFGRNWVSPPGAGLYMSVLLRPKEFAANLPLVTLASGLAVVMAVEIVAGVKLGLKWVNDLVFNGCKVGGILAELQEAGKSEAQTVFASSCAKERQSDRSLPNQALIVGIGINISSKNVQVPEELLNKIQWLEEISQSPVDKNNLVGQISYELERTLELIFAGNILTVLDGWRSYSVTLGENIRAVVGEKIIEGLAVDIADSGALIVKTPQGVQQLYAGDVSIRRKGGSYC